MAAGIAGLTNRSMSSTSSLHDKTENDSDICRCHSNILSFLSSHDGKSRNIDLRDVQPLSELFQEMLGLYEAPREPTHDRHGCPKMAEDNLEKVVVSFQGLCLIIGFAVPKVTLSKLGL